jgi:hypothetical protein
MAKQAGWLPLFVFSVLVCGLGLRLWQPGLIEYKTDESYMFRSTQAEAPLKPFPALGMPSGAGGLVNPGLSIWAFSAPAQLLSLKDPPALSRFVGLSFIFTLLGLFAYVLRKKDFNAHEREIWLWGIALSVANPVMLLFTRKIWAQSLLPVLSVLLFVSWLERKQHPAWRLSLGFFAVLIGQLHMSGFFLGAAVLIRELYDALRARSSWAPLSLGVVLGGIPLIPWIAQFFVGGGATKIQEAVLSSPATWPEFLKFRFWTYVVSFGTGLNFNSSLGHHTRSFLSDPVVATTLTLSGLLVAVLIIRSLKQLPAVLRRRPILLPFQRLRPTGQLLWLGLLLCGLLMTLSNLRIQRHYLILLVPLLAIGISQLALALFPRGGRWALAIYVILQLGLSAELLSYLNRNNGAPGAEFGVAYREQRP